MHFVLFDFFSQEAQGLVCVSKQSAQQVLFQMYNAISIAELKGYAMMQFSWMILRTYGKGLLFISLVLRKLGVNFHIS